MRIIYVLHQFFPRHITGTETYTLEVAKSMAGKNYQTSILCYEHSHFQGIPDQGILDDQYQGLKIKRFCYNLKLSPNPIFYEYYNPVIGEWARKYFKEVRPDLVHFTHSAFLSSSVIEAAISLRIPTILTLTDFWFLCPRMQLLKDNLELCQGQIQATNCLDCYFSSFFTPYNRLSKYLPFFVQKELFKTSHFFMKNIFNWQKNEKNSSLYAALNRGNFLKSVLNKVDIVIAPSKSLKEIYVINGISEDKLTYIPFGINTAWAEGLIRKKSDRIRLGFIGTMSRHKGCDVLIRAFRDISSPNLALKIYGDVNQFPDYGKELIRLSRGDKRIEFLGTFPNDNVGKIFSQLDILVVPSVWYENTPLVVYSALATKTPIIATNLGGLAEVVKEKENGFLFEKGDVEGLKRLIEKILEQPQLIKELEDNIKPVKTVQDNVFELEKIYRELISSR